ncbi:YjiH family protein [Exiguobacterium sp. s7]|jgi:nucleoside recognition membrane protein YjiH|uniref:YjiH family protein n=1 Tax=Exiguobacterium sp. s7 TaxID=2751235 RepID=UPI001BE58B4E|nr:YjiH family protein [Exiguobacterium sp. s7]
MNQTPNKPDQGGTSFTSNDFLKFLIPSLIGLMFFIVPVPTEDGFTIPVALLSNQLIDLIGGIVPTLAVIMMGISVLGSLWTYLAKPAFILERPHFNSLFNVTPFWFGMRVVGFIAGVMTLLVIGPEMITSEFTGGLLLYDLIPILFATFLFAGMLLPLLLNFGLLEYVGTMLIKVMRPLFKLPGRASLDSLASWVGDATIGILLTTKQYENGYYTKREAAVIATTFSVVSITFTIVILSYMELDAYFLQYYGAIVLSGIVAALIMPRIYPLSKKADTPYEETELKPEEPVPANVKMRTWALRQALLKSKSSKGAVATFKDGFQNVLDMWLGILPVVMAVGTIALVIAEYTPLFTILGKPFEPILMLLQVPEAEAAAQTMVVGFADMFLPAVLGSGIESELTRFVIATVSVTQLIFMSEVGGLLLGSKLPISFFDLVLIFLLRTFITLPIIVGIAHLVF